MKVLQICTSESWGGMEMHVAELAEKLMRLGDQCAVVCAPDSRLAKDLMRRSVPCFFLAAGGYIRPVAVWRARTWVAAFQPDVIHVHYARDLWWLVPALRSKRNTPILLSKHVGTQKPKKDPLHRYLYNRLDYIIAISRVIRKNIIATHPIAESRVVIVHHGVDLERFDPYSCNRGTIRRQFGFTDRHIVLGMVGRLQASKGYYEFLEMANLIKDRHPECRFLLVGEASRGEEREAEAILKKLKALGLDSVAQWCGFRKDIPQVLAAMDVFVFPSHAEAFGLVLIEAMAMRRPVISSNCDGVLDIVEQGRSGLLVAPRNVRQLVDAVEKLLTRPEFRQRIAEAGRRRVEKYFNAVTMIQKIREFYSLAVENRHNFAG